jgi:cell division protein FtsB
MSLIFATQLTAVVTAVLAFFAIVTAWYAHRVFLKQSQEVRAIEQQVQDAEELARQQADWT